MKLIFKNSLQKLLISTAVLLIACGGGSDSGSSDSNDGNGKGNSSGTKIAHQLTALNDTGVTTCFDYAYTDTGEFAVTGSGKHDGELDCSNLLGTLTTEDDAYHADTPVNDVVKAGQDALYGRDAIDNNPNDGHGGFSFIKLDSSGNALLDQDVSYDTEPWDCVSDQNTNLMWEVKTDNGDYRWYRYGYSWRNNSGENDAGEAGDGITIVPYLGGSWGCPSAHGYTCTTEGFVSDVNTSLNGICGYHDWRMPTVDELYSLIAFDRFNPTIDTDYFPNTSFTGFGSVLPVHASYWTSSPYTQPNNSFSIYFSQGTIKLVEKPRFRHVRLVRNIEN